MHVIKGHNVKIVQERMGNRLISTTLAFYARATVHGKNQASGVKSRYLKQKPPRNYREANQTDLDKQCSLIVH
jgi:hypothetical protein